MNRRLKSTRREFLQSGAMLIASASVLKAQAASQRVSTLAGTGVLGAAKEGDIASQTQLNNPFGLVIGPDGALYWAEFGSHRILRLDLSSKKVSVIAGNGTKGYSGDGGPAVMAQLNTPHEVRFDSKGNIFIAERDNHVVRFVDMKTHQISTAAGTNVAGFSGDGGPANKAQLNQPHSIALDRSDNVYICDIVNNRVRRIDAKTGAISTFAGTGARTPAPEEGALADTPLPGPRSIDVAPDGKMYLVLREGNKLFVIDTSSGRLRHLAGTVFQYLPRLSVGSRAEVRRVLGGDGEGCHDYLLLTVGCGRERMRRARARKVADVAPSARSSAGVTAVSISSTGNPPTWASGTGVTGRSRWCSRRPGGAPRVPVPARRGGRGGRRRSRRRPACLLPAGS